MTAAFGGVLRRQRASTRWFVPLLGAVLALAVVSSSASAASKVTLRHTAGTPAPGQWVTVQVQSSALTGRALGMVHVGPAANRGGNCCGRSVPFRQVKRTAKTATLRFRWPTTYLRCGGRTNCKAYRWAKGQRVAVTLTWQMANKRIVAPWTVVGIRSPLPVKKAAAPATAVTAIMGVRSPFRVRPAAFKVDPSMCSPRFINLRWSRWTATNARATGTAIMPSHAPATASRSCAAASAKAPRVKVTVTLSNPRVCRGESRRTFRTVSWVTKFGKGRSTAPC